MKKQKTDCWIGDLVKISVFAKNKNKKVKNKNKNKQAPDSTIKS